MSLGPARLLAIVTGLSTLAAGPPAMAQPGPGLARAPVGALDRFDPAPAGDALFGVTSPDVPGTLRLSGSLVASYAHDPLVLRQSGGDPALTWVADQALVHVLFAVDLFRRVKV